MEINESICNSKEKCKTAVVRGLEFNSYGSERKRKIAVAWGGI